MSSHSSSTFTSSSYSYSSSSSSNNNGQHSGVRHSTSSHTDPSGTTVRTSSQNLGEPTIEETRHYDTQGRELLGAPQGLSGNQRRIQDIEVEDVTESENDKKYREAMEDEYAKREGGA